jgi:hypothetical protein
MKEILFLHPAGQAFAFLLGFFNLVSGLTRRMFNISIHVNCGAIYYFMTLLGAGVGVLATKWAEKNGIPVKMELHETLAMVTIFIMAMGATTGLVMMSKPAKRAALLKAHRWINVLSICVYIAQGVTGMTQLINI